MPPLAAPADCPALLHAIKEEAFLTQFRTWPVKRAAAERANRPSDTKAAEVDEDVILGHLLALNGARADS